MGRTEKQEETGMKQTGHQTIAACHCRAATIQFLPVLSKKVLGTAVRQPSLYQPFSAALFRDG
jgi:hypothetical protein